MRTNGIALGPGEGKSIIVVCDTAYTNVPQYRPGECQPLTRWAIRMAQLDCCRQRSFIT